MTCTTASGEQSLQKVSSLSLSLCFAYLVKVAIGGVVAFVLAVMLLLFFGMDDAAALLLLMIIIMVIKDYLYNSQY